MIANNYGKNLFDARSLLHDPEPNIFPTDPTKFGQ